MTTARILPPPVEALDAQQRKLYEYSVSVLGAPIGPRMVLLHHPELAQHWAALAAVLKRASFPDRIRELVILLVARHWRANFEWHAHEELARAEGLSEAAISAIKAGERPVWDDPLDAAVYDYCTSLQERHVIEDAVYDAVYTRLGLVGTVELTALIGQYTSVAMTLVAHRVQLPEGVSPPFGQ